MDLDWHKKQLKDLENLLGPKKNEIDDLNEKLKLHGMHQAFRLNLGVGLCRLEGGQVEKLNFISRSLKMKTEN